MTETAGLTAEEYEVLREYLTKAAYERGYEDGAFRAIGEIRPDWLAVMDVVQYDERERWLVETQASGAAAIVARDVAPWLGQWVQLLLGSSKSVSREDGAPSRGPLLGLPGEYVGDAPRSAVESQDRTVSPSTNHECLCEGEFIWACGPECECFHHAAGAG